MNLKLDELTKEELQKIIEKIAKRLSKEQYEYLQHLITECTEKENTADISPQSLMSQGFVDEKMLQIEEWKQQIEDGKLYLDTEEYEDYGDDYWDREWIIEYYDNQQTLIKCCRYSYCSFDSRFVIFFMISCNSSLVSSANFRFFIFSSLQGKHFSFPVFHILFHFFSLSFKDKTASTYPISCSLSSIYVTYFHANQYFQL